MTFQKLLRCSYVVPTQGKQFFQVCINYRALNKVTVKNKYPILNYVDLLDRLTKASMFTRLYLHFSYQPMGIAKGDEPKTPCVTRYRSYKLLVMPFVFNALAIFYNLMNDVLYKFPNHFVVVYIDDIVICNKPLNVHEKHLTMVFQRLKEHQLYIKKEKCDFVDKKLCYIVIG